jgi:hypothetical protein
MSKQSFVILSTTEGQIYLTHTATVQPVPGIQNIYGDPSLLDISKMWGHYWLYLTNKI